MPLHLIKLSVGSESVESLEAWQAQRLAASGDLWHDTRMLPRRRDELLQGGSIYWVIKGFVQARQPLVDLVESRDGEGRAFMRLRLAPGLFRVEARPCRPFQGWRYLAADQAPADLGGGAAADELPARLAAELRALGVL